MRFKILSFKQHSKNAVRSGLHTVGHYSSLSRPWQRGFSMLEMLVALMISAVMANMALSGLKSLNSPLQNGAAQLAAFLTQVRATAVSQTVAYRVYADAAGRLRTRYGNGCSSATSESPTLQLALPDGTSLDSSVFDLCFTSRGLASQNVILGVRDRSGAREVEVLLGGGVRLL